MAKRGCRFITAWCALVFGKMQDCPWAMTPASSPSYVGLGACDWQESLDVPMAGQLVRAHGLQGGNHCGPFLLDK